MPRHGCSSNMRAARSCTSPRSSGPDLNFGQPLTAAAKLGIVGLFEVDRPRMGPSTCVSNRRPRHFALEPHGSCTSRPDRARRRAWAKIQQMGPRRLRRSSRISLSYFAKTSRADIRRAHNGIFLYPPASGRGVVRFTSRGCDASDTPNAMPAPRHHSSKLRPLG